MFSSLESFWLLLQCCSLGVFEMLILQLVSVFKRTKDSSVLIGLVVWIL